MLKKRTDIRSGTFTPVRADRTGHISFRQTTGALTLADRLGAVRVRLDIGRSGYRVEPGLWACGKPERRSPVLVTANYKLSFDCVRKELGNLDAWILVLDTHGVNVWCAAGKGTFGTDELVRRIRESKLDQLVDHRDLVLPQLCAPGVAGFEVTKATGFRVRFGPVYACDIPAYLDAGMRKTDRMREVRFDLRDRLLIVPVEVMHAARFIPVLAATALALALPAGPGYAQRLGYALGSLAGALVAGTVLFPALLPVLPFRAFSAKGGILGLLWSALHFLLSLAVGPRGEGGPGILAAALGALPATLVSVPLVAYIAMNYTGSSTFTCQKGAELEVRRSLPAMIVSGAAGILLAASRGLAAVFGLAF